jgi:hypothetical protein
MKNIPRMAIVAIAIILVAIAGIVLWVHSHHAQPAMVVQTKTLEQTISPAPATAVSATNPNAAQMRLAIVHKGEGVENAFIRQFVASPAAYGFNGKQDDTKAIHQWAGRQAHLLAIKTGYYDYYFGAEVRVATPYKMAYVIQKDGEGNLTVVEYKVNVSAKMAFLQKNAAGKLTNVEYEVTTSAATPAFSQGATHVSSAIVSVATFFGASPITGNKIPVPQGEYVYFPGV